MDTLIAFTQIFTPENWIAFAIALLTLALVLTGILQFRWGRIAHMQAHTPAIKSDMSFPKPSSPGYVAIINSGLGPGFLQEINFYRNGEKVGGNLGEASADILNHLGDEQGPYLQIVRPYAYQQGYVVSKDEKVILIEFDYIGTSNPDMIDAYLKHQEIQIEIVYQDIFGRRHVSLDPRAGKEL